MKPPEGIGLLCLFMINILLFDTTQNNPLCQYICLHLSEVLYTEPEQTYIMSPFFFLWRQI